MAFTTIAAIREAIGVIESAIGSVRAPIGMVLGSGLGGLAEEIEDARSISYSAIPHLPVSTVPGHAGRLVAGRWQGREVVVLEARDVGAVTTGHSTAKVSLLQGNVAGGIKHDEVAPTQGQCERCKRPQSKAAHDWFP